MVEEDFGAEVKEPASLITQAAFRTMENQVRCRVDRGMLRLLRVQPFAQVPADHASQPASRYIAGTAHEHSELSRISRQNVSSRAETSSSIWWS